MQWMGRGLMNEGMMYWKHLEQEAEEVEEMAGSILSVRQRQCSPSRRKSTTFGSFSIGI
jgi:hypothetical protein